MNDFGSSSPLRLIRRVTCVPSSPLIWSAALSTVMPFVLLPSIAKISSSASKPAFSAGVSSIGAITINLPSFIPICIPIPFSEPLIELVSSKNSFGFKNFV